MGACATDEEKVREVSGAPERLFVPYEDTERVDEPHLRYVFTPSRKDSWPNRVHHFAFADADADSAIDALLARFRGASVPLKWIVGPGSSPADLAERLERRGLVRYGARAMACETGVRVDAPSSVVVEPLGVASVDVYADTLARGFAQPLPELRAHVEHVLRSGRITHLFLARIGGVPVGAASLSELGRSGFLDAGAVVGEARGRGVYRALVAARLADLRARGIALATTQAREGTSAPILAHLGFETLYRFDVLASPDAAPGWARAPREA